MYIKYLMLEFHEIKEFSGRPPAYECAMRIGILPGIFPKFFQIGKNRSIFLEMGGGGAFMLYPGTCPCSDYSTSVLAVAKSMVHISFLT